MSSFALQIYHHVRNGWLVICVLFAALLALSFTMALIYTGERPLLTRWLESFGCMGTITLPEEATADAMAPIHDIARNLDVLQDESRAEHA
jgi:hypothetical protein